MNRFGLLISPFAALLLAPLLGGMINRTKAFFAGRRGQPLLQVYYDLWRLWRKESVYSRTTSCLFRIAPALIFGLTLAATLFVPFWPLTAPIGFSGDLIVLLYLLGLARFFLILTALDTGSAFEGMGASREAFFSALAEPVVLLCLLNIVRAHHADSLMTALAAPALTDSITLVLTTLPLFLILLAENARIPFDDPNTHLELTMIHEVMILDHSGRGLALLEYAAAIKLWIFSLILGRIILPVSATQPILRTIVLLLLIGLVAIIVGIIESVTARVRLLKIPQLLLGAGVLAALGFFISVTHVLIR